MKLDRDLCYRAGQDAGNRSMRAAGRTKWNEDDWNISCETFERLLAATNDKSNAAKSTRKRFPQ